jgi:hypothetical protein
MLDYHSAKLLQVYWHALSCKMLVLKTYIYLRDAAAKSYYHESITEKVWELISKLLTPLHGRRDHDSFILDESTVTS